MEPAIRRALWLPNSELPQEQIVAKVTSHRFGVQMGSLRLPTQQLDTDL
jgi:hypothetical protein